MLGDINIFKMASAMARYAAQRHQQLSENISNADTNNYRAKDLEPFADAYARFEKKTKLGDGFDGLPKGGFAKVLDVPGAESPNGNTVSLEDQMMRSVAAQQDHETATTLYKKSIGILRMTLNGGA